MSEQNLMVSPEKLGAEIRELTRQAKAMTLYYGVEIGRRLEAAKSMVPYGGWGAWLKENTEFSQATATRFMRVFNEYGAEQIGIFGAVPESSTLQNLSISNALRLLAVPEDEREEFAEAVDAENLSARELEKAIKERDAARQERESALRQANSDSLRAENAKKEAESLKQQLAAAKAMAEAASSDAEKERLAGEVEDLRRKLAMSDKDVTAAQLYFYQWQAAFNQLTQAISHIKDEDKAGKLCAAIRAQMAAWGKAMEGTT